MVIGADGKIELARRWVTSFTTNRHPDLGRDGVVCPYTTRALRRGYLTFHAFDARTGDDAMVAFARGLRDDIAGRAGALGSDAVYLVRIAVPYGLPEADLKAMVGRVHARLRAEFVEGGYMAGDFWPDHTAGGLHNPAFRPFASPLPLFGVRHMVTADLAFFCLPDVPPDVRVEYLARYRRFFGGDLNAHWTQVLEEAETRARRELQAA